MNHSKIVQDMMGLPEQSFYPGSVYSNEEIVRLANRAGWGSVYDNNFNMMVQSYHAIVQLLIDNNKMVKIHPDFSLFIADIGDIAGCYIYPQNIIVLNAWHVLNTPLEIANHTLPHEIAHWYCVDVKNHKHHGEPFADAFLMLTGRVEAKPKLAKRELIIKNLQDQAAKIYDLMEIIE